MNFLTLLSTLESSLNRETTNYQGMPTCTWKGSITKVTVNSNDEYTNVYQLFITHDTSGVVTLHINHSKSNYTADYKLSNISTLVIT